MIGLSPAELAVRGCIIEYRWCRVRKRLSCSCFFNNVILSNGMVKLMIKIAQEKTAIKATKICGYMIILNILSRMKGCEGPTSQHLYCVVVVADPLLLEGMTGLGNLYVVLFFWHVIAYTAPYEFFDTVQLTSLQTGMQPFSSLAIIDLCCCFRSHDVDYCVSLWLFGQY